MDRDVEMNILNAKVGQKKAIAEDMFLKWHSIVGNLVAFVDTEQVIPASISSDFKTKSLKSLYFVAREPRSQIHDNKDFSNIKSPNFCK